MAKVMTKRFFLLLAVVLLCVSVAQAQSAGNVFAGYSFTKAPGSVTPVLNGWSASLEGRVLPHIGLVVEGGGYTGSKNFNTFAGSVQVAASNSDFKRLTFLAGPRVSLSVGRYRPFAHVLVGGSRVEVSTTTHVLLTSLVSHSASTSYPFTAVTGGGVDVRLMPHVSWRLQSDYMRAKLNNYRFVTGVAFSF